MTAPEFRLIARAAAALATWTAATASALGGIAPPPEVTVVEFRNTILNHYFLTAFPEEIAAIEAGAAGPGWSRTGFAFTAYAYENPWCQDCRPVRRYYAPGPNSHFFSTDTEVDWPGSGWNFEGIAFAIPRPRADQTCAVGIPVYRLYNNRWMFNDSNHRFVTSLSVREAMLAEGWADEGVRFCALGSTEAPVRSFRIDVPLEGNILPSAECEDDRVRTGGCIAVNNLPVPRIRMATGDPTLFSVISGNSLPDVYVANVAPPEAAARDVFVQATGGGAYGIQVETHGKAVPALSSVNPLYQFATSPEAGDRFFPWRPTQPFETELAIRWFVSVARLEARGPDSHAYGHPTLEFVDQASGHHVYFTVLAYGTLEGDGDYLAPDIGTGKVIVGTTPRADTPYGRAHGSRALAVPRSFSPDYTQSRIYGSFDFRLDRAAFTRVLAAARSVDAALSSDPDDYLLDNFHFNNEVYGDGRIGLSVELRLDVVRR